MKRLNLLILVFLALFVSTAWAQTKTSVPGFGKRAFPPYEIHNAVSRNPSTAIIPNFGLQETDSRNIKVRDLGAFPGGRGSWAVDISNVGVAVGGSDMSGWNQQHPMMIWLFGPTTAQWMDLGTLGADGGGASGVSDTGIIVGDSYTIAGDDHAFVWTSKTGMVDLGTLSSYGHTRSVVHEVNQSGTLIVGWSAFSDYSDMRPVVWIPSMERTKDGLVTTWKIHELNISALGQYANGGANTVNNRGQIAGGVWGDAGWTGVVWNPIKGGKEWKPVQLFGSAEYPIVSPQHINDHGELVGTSCKMDWSACGAVVGEPVGGSKKIFQFTDLPNPWGVPNGDLASGINNRGDIVGHVNDDTGTAHAALWSAKDPKSVELMPSMGVWSVLEDVNESGLAVGEYGTADFMHGIAVQLH